MRMVPNLTPTTFVLLTFGVSTFIFIMLLPALLELKRPKDAGPRVIMEGSVVMQSEIRSLAIVSVEEEREFDRVLVEKIADVIAVLPNLEV